MAILKTYIHHNGSSQSLEKYIFKDGRSLAEDHSLSMEGFICGKEYGKAFDALRKIARKDSGRKTYHFVISPDPKNHATLEEVRMLATNWATKNLPNAYWYIGYHKDGSTGEIHAHIAANSVDENGMKLQFDSDQWAELANSAHSIAAKMGIITNLATVGRLRQQKTSRDIVETMAERQVRVRGGWSWKDDIRKAVDVARKQSKDFRDFQEHLEKKGYSVVFNLRGGFTYFHPYAKRDSNNHNFKVKDSKLGKEYSPSAILAEFKTDYRSALFGENNPVEEYRLRVEAQNWKFKKVPTNIPRPKNYLDHLYRRSVSRGVKDVKAYAKALHYLRENNLVYSKHIRLKLHELRHDFDEAIDKFKDAQSQAYLALDVIEYAKQYESTLKLAKELEQRPSFLKNRFEQTHSEELAKFGEAKKWLENHGFNPLTARVNAERSLSVAQKNAQQHLETIDKKEAEIKEIGNAVKLVIEKLAPLDIRAYVEKYTDGVGEGRTPSLQTKPLISNTARQRRYESNNRPNNKYKTSLIDTTAAKARCEALAGQIHTVRERQKQGLTIEAIKRGETTPKSYAMRHLVAEDTQASNASTYQAYANSSIAKSLDALKQSRFVDQNMQRKESKEVERTANLDRTSVESLAASATKIAQERNAERRSTPSHHRRL